MCGWSETDEADAWHRNEESSRTLRLATRQAQEYETLRLLSLYGGCSRASIMKVDDSNDSDSKDEAVDEAFGLTTLTL